MSESHHHNCCQHSHSNSEESTQVQKLSQSITSTFLVSGMDCADEIAAIQKSLTHPQVGKITANLISSQVTVEHDPTLKKETIVQLINRAGVRVREENAQVSFYTEHRSRVWLVSGAGIALTLGLVLQWTTSLTDEILLFPFLLSTLLGATLILPKAVRALQQKILDMNVLMILAAVGAFLIQEYSEGAAVVFLFSLAEMLEAFSVARARKAIREVLSLTPQMASVEIDNQLQNVEVERIEVGQTIVVLAGDRIPMDGLVVKGNSSVNQAPLTGESTPISKLPGDSVFAGTVNESGTLKIQVTHSSNDSKISNVIRLIEEAQSKKAPSQLFVDRFAKIYTPAVTAIAILVAIIPPIFLSSEWNTWFYRALVFLVIACPCALVIATPVSIVSALTALARMGVLVKGGVYLEALGKLRALAVDKTGTITEGAPRVISAKKFKEMAEIDYLTVVYSLERESTHPLARAVDSYCKEKNILAKQVQEFKLLQGLGIEGRIDQHVFFVGNHKLAHSLGVCTPELESYLTNLEDSAQSVLVIGHKPHSSCQGELLGVLGLADEPRPHVRNALQDLHKAGIEQISMLSGDNQRTVNSIAKRVGIDSAYGDLLPENKVSEIQSLLQRYKYVGMIGDGINDAPALAVSTIGIAMGGAGTDAAIETADVALMTDNLGQMAQAIEHSRKALRIIRFNIWFAIVTKSVFIVLGIFGYSSLWLAVAADTGATLLVIANSVRLLRIRV